jgi:tetratricopeptide (TPR) repeat protein
MTVSKRCLIEAYLVDGDVKNAKACIEKAIVKYPNDAILYTLGGDVYEKLGAHDEALRCWDQAIELDDALLDAKYSKLDYYLQIGEKDRSYQLMLEIVGELKKAGLDIEAAGEEKRLKERINRQ